jgi:prepilin-type N-terminal cleavage/methylation domain-containing protein
MFIQNNKGFTLLEVMVAIGIMVILLTVVMVNYRDQERRSTLNFEAQKMVSVLKRAQMMALTGKEVNGSRPTGYGIFFPNNISYFLFADQNKNYKYDMGEEIENFKLTANMTVATSGIIGDVAFALPEADVYFDGGLGVGEAKIIFQHAGISLTKEVIIKGETGKVE